MDLQEAGLLPSLLLLLDRRRDMPALKTVAGRTGGEYRFLKEERTLRACPGNTTGRAKEARITLVTLLKIIEKDYGVLYFYNSVVFSSSFRSELQNTKPTS